MTSPQPLWERAPGESGEAHQAFLAYRDLGQGRTLLEAYRQVKSKPAATQAGGDWTRWSTRHAWVQRALAWDDHIQRERDRVLAQRAARWERRRHLALEADFEVAQKLREKGLEMLAAPLYRREVTEDGRTVVMRPVRFTLGTAIEALRVAGSIEAAVLQAAGPTASQLEFCSPAELRAIEDAACEPIPGEE